MSFLPVDYKAPKSSNYYMKLVEGENRIRIMSKPVMGWEDWHDKKPVRYALDNKPLKPFDPKKPIKHFWSFVVFNYNEEQIQIMHITQGTIRKSIEALCNDKDWGSPYAFDIKIMKTGDGMETEYAVNPVPHKAIDPYLITCYNERRCNLNALFDNSDPVTIEGDNYTKRGTPEDDRQELKLVEPKGKITQDQADNLKLLLQECSDEFVKSTDDFMKKQRINTYKDLPTETFERILKKALEERAKQYNKKLENNKEENAQF